MHDQQTSPRPDGSAGCARRPAPWCSRTCRAASR